MDHPTSPTLGGFVRVATLLGMAAVLGGCDGGESSNAGPEKAIASPRSEINANPSSAATRPLPASKDEGAVSEVKKPTDPHADRPEVNAGDAVKKQQ